MKNILLSLVLTLIATITISSAFTQARVGVVKGKIVDSTDNSPLASATINILDAKDSTLLSFGRTNDKGEFSISRLKTGELILLVTYTGFAKKEIPFSLSEASPQKEFGDISMLSSTALEDVTVTAAPVVIKGDTVEYNAGSFKVNKPNAVVEDLLKRLPGVEVDTEGNIKANGQDVKRVLVDGKEFFANDPKLATKNLQADMVKKVQVYEKKSDRSEFTGFDDGNTEPTINLTLKEDKRTGVFGRVSGGYGSEDRYKANANVNSFKKGEQMSFIGQANNINERGFSLMDALSFSSAGGRSGGGSTVIMGGGGGRSGGLQVAGFGGGNSQGISATQAAGLNYNNFKNKKVDFTSSYFFNGTQTKNVYDIRRELTVGDSTQLYLEPGVTQRDNFNHRVNLGLDYRLDSFNSIKVTSRISFQNSENTTNKVFSTLGPKGNTLSDGINNTANENSGYNIFTNALYRKKFSRAGRTFSADLNFTTVDNNGSGSQFTINNRYGNFIRRDTLDQRNFTDANNLTYGATISYTEPMSRRSLLELSLFHNNNQSNNDQRTFNLNPFTGEYDLVNEQLTNFFENEYMNSGAGVNFKENRTGWNYTIGGRLQRAELTSTVQGKADPISQTFVNFLPSAQIQIGKNRYRNFRIFYNGNTSNPSVQQLQPVADISDPLNITIGNPDLKQSFTNAMRINYTSFDPYTMQNFFAFFNVSQTFNDIVNNDSIGAFGGRVTTYDNVNGVYNINGSVNFGFPIRIGDEDRINLNFGTSGSFRNNVNLLNDEKNIIKNLTLSQRMTASFAYKQLFDLSLGGNISWNNARYSLQASQNTNFYSYGVNLDMNFFLPKGFVAQTDINYNGNAGRADGFNPNFTLWNASVAKTFLKNNKGELRLSVFDLLKQNTGVQRDVNANYVQDTRYTVLQQYFMLTFTYNLSKFGAPGGPNMRQGMRMMMMN